MSRAVEKDYLALCRGWPEPAFTVDHPLDGGPGKPEKKPALTRFVRLATGELPLYVDGADECDTHKRLIKGGGAALTREKIIAAASDK